MEKAPMAAMDKIKSTYDKFIRKMYLENLKLSFF